jgi:amino acid adenylation domain-containing protein
VSENRQDIVATEVEYDPFVSPAIARAVPTTDAQREVWLANQLGTDASLAYNESISMRLEGRLDVAALQRALRALSDRHESLRATISDDGLSLLIAADGALQADLHDLAALDAEEREVAASAVRLDAVRVPFDLVSGPLVRTSLLRLEDTSHELVFTAHHVICDGWSFGVITRELMALYAAFASGQQPTLGAADAFSDFAVISVEQQQATEADEKYWLSVFDGSVPVLDLPTDRPRGMRREFASLREDLRIEPVVVDALRRVAAQRGVSLFATLFGLFAGLMSRLAGETDVVVGVPSAGQAARGMQNLVGHCVNLLPVRVAADPQQSVESLLLHARERVLDAYEHQACTFGRLLSKLQLKRDASRLPLVSVQFNLDTAIDVAALSVSGLRVSVQSNPREFENFDLFVNATQAGGAIVLECQYNTALFDAETVRHWLEILKVAADRCAGNPQQRVGELFRATDLDVAAFDRLNSTSVPYPQNTRVELLVSSQAQRTPDEVAVVADGSQLTYRELDERANALASELSNRGVTPGALVGLACSRSEHLVVGLLGILKAGAGYVPLDPAFPLDRLDYMCSDAGLRVIVVDAVTAGANLACGAEAVRADLVVPTSLAPPASTDMSAAAYVLYTSGSTGQPKGVVVPQRALVNFLHAMLLAPGLRPSDRLVAVTTASFDIAVLELLLPLVVGARVIVADRDTVKDALALQALLEMHDATVMQATPSGWRILLESGWAGSANFKALIGGEPLPRDLAQQLLDRTKELWNGYGPTETTIYSSNWLVPDQPAFITIGRPVSNTFIDVLDDQLRLCPVGMPGEICIGGDGVADGYLHRPELTAEKFVIDPRRPGRRIYRTGDRGRLRSDGLLEHMGRMDFQVKVRGYRIELGDVEANMVSSGQLSRVVVVVREDRPGDPRLVAYCVLNDSGADIAQARERLREHARGRLPEYMVPQHIEFLDAIPLLPNGKINRKALPVPGAGGSDSELRVIVEPATEIEGIVRDAMQAVLNVNELSMTDDFFLMGGHSLLASRLVVRLGRELGISLPLRSAFEHATPATLSAHIAKVLSAGGTSSRPGIARSAATVGPLTVMQERIRFMEAMYPGRVVYNTPSAHRLTGPFDYAAFSAAFDAMVRRQSALRTVIAGTAQAPEQHVLESVSTRLPIEDLSAIPATERDSELMLRLHRVIDEPISIHEAPLFRARLYRLGEQEHVFLFMPHHIIWDGWSFDLLYAEMSELYSAQLGKREATLPAVPVSYIDYARWHADWMRGDECSAQVAFWRQRYAELPQPGSLPTDRVRRAGMTGVGAVEWIHVDGDLTQALRKNAQDCGATLNMLVMAAYSAMLTEALGGDVMVLGIPVRGRLVSEVENVMGFFNNLLPVPVRVQPDIQFKEWVQVVKRELLEAFANQDVPFERLMEEPDVARHAGTAGLYQSLFSFQDARERERHWGPLSHSSVLVMQKGATEDFGLWLMEVPGGLEGGVNYNADLFEPATAALFRERLVAVLRRAAASPGLSVRELINAPGVDGSAFTAWILAARARAADLSAASRTAAGIETTLSPNSNLDESAATLAEIWSSLLGIDPQQIRADDNFFDLGGNSLLVMQAVALMEKELGQAIDPRRYVHETLAQLSRVHESPAPGVGTVVASAEKGVLRRWLGRLGGKV